MDTHTHTHTFEQFRADEALAARIEALAAAEARRFTRTAQGLDSLSPAVYLDIADGAAAYLAPESPMNRAMGLGMVSPVEDDDLVELEQFYLERDVSPQMGVCPLSHPSLLEGLSARGWQADGFENVLARTLGSGDAPSPHELPQGIEIREVDDDESRALWKLVAATGFSWPLTPADAQLELGEIVVNRPGTRLLLAFHEGRAAGAAELMIEDGVAWLSADATLVQFRGRGVQQALQLHRLALGAAAGCDLAVSEAAPGSGSQRNMERIGFRVAYTRLDMVLLGTRPAQW